MNQLEVEEALAVRGDCVYSLHEMEPTSGRWWAVQALPVTPPGELHAKTPDGAPVESACIVACQRRSDDGLWQWCHLTPTAKRIWGDMVFAAGSGRWWYIVETDRLRGEAAEGGGK